MAKKIISVIRHDRSVDDIKTMRDELTALLEITDKNAQPVARLLRLVDSVEENLRGLMDLATKGCDVLSNTRRESRLYEIQQRNSAEVLVESWPGKAVEPYRCSFDFYETVAAVMNSQKGREVSFEELVDRIRAKISAPPIEHHVRMCLRFWLGTKILTRNRFQYQPAKKGDFVVAALAQWKLLAAKRPAD